MTSPAPIREPKKLDQLHPKKVKTAHYPHSSLVKVSVQIRAKVKNSCSDKGQGHTLILSSACVIWNIIIHNKKVSALPAGKIISKWVESLEDNLIKIRSLRSLLKDLMKPHTKVKSCDLSIMHDHNAMRRHKLSSDWINTHMTKQGFR